MLDENLEEFTFKRKTVHWPYALAFVSYNMLDIAVNNSLILMQKRLQKAEKRIPQDPGFLVGFSIC